MVQGWTAHPTPNATPDLQRLPAGTPGCPPAKPEREDPPRAWASARVTPLTGAGWAMAFASRRGPGGAPAGPPQPRREPARGDRRPSPGALHAGPRTAGPGDAPQPQRPLRPGGVPADPRTPGSKGGRPRPRPRPRRTERAGARRRQRGGNSVSRRWTERGRVGTLRCDGDRKEGGGSVSP